MPIAIRNILSAHPIYWGICLDKKPARKPKSVDNWLFIVENSASLWTIGMFLIEKVRQIKNCIPPYMGGIFLLTRYMEDSSKARFFAAFHVGKF